MRRTITALVATASIAAAGIAAPKPAEARCIGCWVGAGIAAAVIGGAIASSSYGYGYGYPAYSYTATATPHTATVTATRPTATTTVIRRTATPIGRLTMDMPTRRDVTMGAGTTVTEPYDTTGRLCELPASRLSAG